MARRSPAASSSSVANAFDKPGSSSSSSSSSYYYRPHWPRKQHFQVPYHKLDDIEEDCSDKVDLYESYIPKEETQQEESSESESESEEEEEGGKEQAQVPAPSLTSFARLRRRKNMSMLQQRRGSRGVVGLKVGSSSSSSYSSFAAASRRTRWRRMRLRINLCRVRFNWLSPFEFLKKLRKAYIQAMLSMSSKEGQCGLVVMGSPWSFPVVVPFRNGVC